MSIPLTDALPCGADLDLLLDHVVSGAVFPGNDHEAHCVHCRAAHDDIATLWAPVRSLSQEKVTAPPGVVESAMRRIKLISANTWHAVITGDPGVTRIATRVVAVIARRSAARVPGVHVALGRSTEARQASHVATATDRHHATDSAVGVAGVSAVVELALAADYGQPIPELAERVRRTVSDDVRQLTGIENVQVNITVDDVVEPGA